MTSGSVEQVQQSGGPDTLSQLICDSRASIAQARDAKDLRSNRRIAAQEGSLSYDEHVPSALLTGKMVRLERFERPTLRYVGGVRLGPTPMELSSTGYHQLLPTHSKSGLTAIDHPWQ